MLEEAPVIYKGIREFDEEVTDYRGSGRLYARPGLLVAHPARPAALSLPDGGGIPLLAGVRVLVRVHDAQEAVLADADYGAALEGCGLCFNWVPIHLNGTLLYQTACLTHAWSQSAFL